MAQNPFAPATVDFSQLANLPAQFRQGQAWRREDDLRDAFKGGLPKGPNGEIDFGAMVGALAPHDPIAAANIAASRANTDATANYRAQSLVPEEIRMMQYFGGSVPDMNGGAGAVPGDAPTAMPGSLAQGGGQPSGQPAAPQSYSSMPGFMARKFMSPGQLKAEEAQGKASGERAASQEKIKTYRPKVQNTLKYLRAQARKYDQTTFENALGPWQGSGGTDTLSAASAFIPQTFGAARNAIEGGKGSTSEVRSAVIGGTRTLAAAIKPLIRGPGEGPWTDADQAQLESIVGDLQFSRDINEYERRLGDVVGRLNAAFGLDLSPEDIGLSPVDPTAAQVQPQGNQPPDSAIQHLRANPQLRGEFEAKYGVSADQFLGQ